MRIFWGAFSGVRGKVHTTKYVFFKKSQVASLVREQKYTKNKIKITISGGVGGTGAKVREVPDCH